MPSKIRSLQRIRNQDKPNLLQIRRLEISEMPLVYQRKLTGNFLEPQNPLRERLDPPKDLPKKFRKGQRMGLTIPGIIILEMSTGTKLFF